MPVLSPALRRLLRPGPAAFGVMWLVKRPTMRRRRSLQRHPTRKLPRLPVLRPARMVEEIQKRMPELHTGGHPAHRTISNNLKRGPLRLAARASRDPLHLGVGLGPKRTNVQQQQRISTRATKEVRRDLVTRVIAAGSRRSFPSKKKEGTRLLSLLPKLSLC